MPAILVVRAPDGLVEHLRPRREWDIDVEDDPGAALDALTGGRDAVTIVLGPTVDHPVQWTQHLRRHLDSVPVLVISHQGDHAAVDSEVRTAPLIGRATHCLPPDADPAVWADLVMEAAAAELSRRTHQLVLERLRGREPGTGAPGPPPPQYLGQLIEHAPIGVITVDADGLVRGWNPMATTLFGRRSRDIVGRSLFTLFPEDQQHELRRAWLAADPGGTPHVASRTSPHGLTQHLEITITAIDPSLPPLGSLVLVHDVTERVQAHTELTARAAEAGLAADVGMALTSTAPFDERLHDTVDAVVRRLDAAFARIWLLDEVGQTLVLRASAGMYQHLDGEHGRVRMGEWKIGRIAATRRPHLTNNVVDDTEISDRGWAQRESMVAFAGYPLVVGDELVGVLALFARHPLDESTTRALTGVVGAVAVAVRRERAEQQVIELFELERAARHRAEEAAHRHANLARTLQRGLLPPALPEVPGFDVAASYHWAGDGTLIGGDFYDMFRLADDRWCAAIGDVTGKGPEAAAVTALARYTLRAGALDTSTTADLLALLNRAMLAARTDRRFSTIALVAVAPTDHGAVAEINLAGHPAPLWLLRDEVVEVDAPHNPPVGVFPGTAYEPTHIQLAADDILTLYTDGATEARDHHDRFADRLLETTLAGLHGRSAAHIVDAATSAVIAYQNGNPRDDLALVALRCRPSTGPR